MVRAVHAVRWAGIVAAAALLVGGCKKKPVEVEAGPDDAEVAVAAPVEAAAAPATASNDGDVTKYPGQNADTDTLTARLNASARTEASATGGKLVATVKAGTQVHRLADHEGYNLVTFPDPSDGTKLLEGWVAHTAFGSTNVLHLDGGMVFGDGGGAVIVSDAAAPPAQRTTPLDVKKSATGTCPGGYASCGAMCRATCKTDPDCQMAAAHCSAGFCLGPGATPCH